MRFGFGRGGGKRSRVFYKQAPICGNCICPNCNTVIPHKKGVPCFQTVCPNCGKFMTRKFNSTPNE